MDQTTLSNLPTQSSFVRAFNFLLKNYHVIFAIQIFGILKYEPNHTTNSPFLDQDPDVFSLIYLSIFSNHLVQLYAIMGQSLPE